MAKRKRDESDDMRLTADDRHDIANLIHGFLHALDGNDPIGFSSLFDDDATCEIVKFAMVKKGGKELEALCSSLAEKFAGISHWEGNVFITGSGDRAANLSYWKAVCGGDIVSQGRHEDSFVKKDGVWKIEGRKIFHTWSKAGGHEEDCQTATSLGAKDALRSLGLGESSEKASA
jgi:hypothetical protein